jgi:hypothetical protein
MRWLRSALDAAENAEIEALRRRLDIAQRELQEETRASRERDLDRDAMLARLEADVEYLVAWRAREMAALKAERLARTAAGQISELQLKDE